MAETSIALYRKYRPDSFDGIRGQDHILKVLKGALRSKNVPHALLFAGPRGTGKTSVARIFASAAGAEAVDIYEMDAASNRGIDDVRELREAVHTLPYESPRKVYIIDEVHMLTKDAWNALLKTLEEPPEHVLFILATTELDKVLDTILSRCQVFRFKIPTRAMLRDTVLDVAKEEKFALSPEGADLVAIAADGSFRDALGITQKVIMASSDRKADADEVAELIGAPKGSLVMDIVLSLHEKNTEKGLKAIKKAVAENVDMRLFMRLLLERVRVVILARYARSDAEEMLAQFGDEDRKALEKLSADSASPLNSHLLLRLLDASAQMSRTYLPHLPLELAVIELTT